MCTSIISVKEKSHNSQVSGFTLVELSIVLVIIGLIVGGVLVGQDLIRAAENRAIISQIEKYNTSVNTFKVKYNGIPGDISNATSYLTTPSVSGAVAIANGDGNGVLTTAPTTLASGENTQFWEHLTSAGMIDGAFNGIATATTLGVNFPYTKSNRGGIFAYGLSDGLNYYQIGLATVAGTTITTAVNLKPEEALAIDTKIDDGMPATGGTQALGGTTLNAAYTTAAAGSAGCAVTTALTYNVTYTSPACQLKIRFN